MHLSVVMYCDNELHGRVLESHSVRACHLNTGATAQFWKRCNDWVGGSDGCDLVVWVAWPNSTKPTAACCSAPVIGLVSAVHAMISVCHMMCRVMQVG
jgi:hypothetical protein